jgi:glycosyltransferase involved in cell wall biosynthesis
MKLAIDARMINKSGIGTCIRQWLQYIHYDIILGNKEELEKFDSNLKHIIPFNTGIYGYKEQISFPYRKLSLAKPDILHIPHCNIPLLYRGKLIVTVHDLTHLIYPEFLPIKLAKFYFKFIFWFICKRADRIITVSQNTKNDLLRFFNVSSNKISVVPLGVSEEFKEKPKEEISYLYDKFSIPHDKKILLYVGNLLPHKNLSRLLEAFSKMKGKEDCRLVLVGKAFDGRSKSTDESNLGIDQLTIHTGIVDQEDLVNLYNLADLFVLPSLYEGFGLPVLEALACGTPVACSKTSSLPEVGGSVVNYFDPISIDDMATVLFESLNKETSSKESIRDWIQQFSWEKTSKQILNIAQEVFNEP